MMINSNKNSIYYIICPENFATGGPEALHQLGAELQNNGKNVKMVYLDLELNIATGNPVHQNYIKYNLPWTSYVENKSSNILILPETYCSQIWNKRWSEMQKIVWWLSVTNFFIVLDDAKNYYKKKSLFWLNNLLGKYPIPSIERIRKSNAKHLAHSYFSVDFLHNTRLKRIGQISDYMNEKFLGGENYTDQKEDIIIYNPVKNGEFLDKIKNLEKKYQWIPIQNMSPEQVSELMKKAKIYIDFGYHPGKERMPREACLMDCCLIIGKKGSAAFKEDMPIPEKFRFDFEDKQIPQILTLIQNIMQDYHSNYSEIKPYKSVLLNEKKKFSEDVKKVFG